MFRFRIDKNNLNLTWEEYEALEMAQEGEVKLRRLRPLVARFMVDEAGQPIPHKQAIQTLGKLPMAEVTDIFQQFAQAMTETAIPKGTATQLKPPSEPATQTSESPTGSQP